MCAAGQKRPAARGLWNAWLEERELAPGDALVEWLRGAAGPGLETALEAARAALEAALQRAAALRDGAAAEAPAAWAAWAASEGEGGAAARGPGAAELEGLVAELFRLQDLDGDGLLQEEELVLLSRQVAALRGGGGPAEDVGERCRDVFRRKLDPEGRPVDYQAFRQHMLQVLTELDPNEHGHIRMVQQFIAEAQAGRAALCCESIARGSDARTLLRQAPPAASSSGHAPSTSTQQAHGAPEVLAGQASLQAHGAPEVLAGQASLQAHGAPEVLAGQTPLQTLSFADRVQSISAQGESSSHPKEETRGTPERREPTIDGPTPGVVDKAESKTVAEQPDPGRKPQCQAQVQDRALEGRCEGAARPGCGPAEEAPRCGKAESFDSVGSFVPTPSRDGAAGFARGEALQVWSNSKGLWLDGVVEELFAEACEAEGYSVPAGTLKVRSSAGVKWVMAGQAAGVLRRRGA